MDKSGRRVYVICNCGPNDHFYGFQVLKSRRSYVTLKYHRQPRLFDMGLQGNLLRFGDSHGATIPV